MDWRAYLLAKAFGFLIGMMTEERLKGFADTILDYAEDWKTDGSEWDERVDEVCANIRKAFNIPDNDDVV